MSDLLSKAFDLDVVWQPPVGVHRDGGVAVALDGKRVEAINSRLMAKPERPDPAQLSANAGCSFQGSIVLGMGFTLTPEERDSLIRNSRKNAQCILPYLGGEEVNTNFDQSHDRYVISFGQMELEEAEKWPDLIGIVRRKVKPERDKNKREVRKKYWWRFGEAAPALYQAIAPLERCLVTSRVTKHLMFHFQPSDRIFAESLYVFPFDTYGFFAIVQSRIHEFWARLLCSSMKMDLRYTASAGFATFPFPKGDPRALIPALERIGERLYDARAAFMRETKQGLTTTYNLLKDPKCHAPHILKLRELHEALDRDVLAAYGWSDIPVPPYCVPSPEDDPDLQAFKDEVIDRLLVLNAERARNEREERDGFDLEDMIGGP